MNAFQKKWCEDILRKLEQRPISTYFKEVDGTTLEHSSYERDSKHPIDFTGVRRNMANGQYQSIKDWGEDIQWILSHVRPRKDTEYYDMMARELYAWFEKKWREYPRSEHEMWFNKLNQVKETVEKLYSNMPVKKVLIPEPQQNTDQ